MTQVLHSKLAKLDLLSIWAYIAEDNPNAADKLLESIDEKCKLLAENPKLGQARPDIAPTMRYFPIKNYLILYQEHASGIEVVRVIQGSRDLNAIILTE